MRGPHVVVAGHGVEHLGEDVRLEPAGALFDQAEPQVDVTEERTLGGREEERAAVELPGASEVVEKRSRQEDVRPEARVELGDLPAQGGDADRVGEKPAGPRVVTPGRRGQDSQARAELGVAGEAPDEAAEPGVGDLGDEELEEALELVQVPPGLGHELRRVGLGRLERANLELEAVAEALHPAKDAHRVALAEALVEELDVVPDASLDPPRRIDELESEIGSAGAGSEPALPGHCVEAFDDPILGQLRDRHPPILGPGTDGKLAAVPLLKPFRALRYDEGRVGSLDDVVAPPYDVIDPAAHASLLARSPWNAVRLTRPGHPEDAARLLAGWQEQGVLVREERPGLWLLEDEYAGPDGVQRTRRGLVGRARLDRFGEGGAVLPHEHTFSGPTEARLSLLRATRMKPSPIFMLHRGRAPEPAGEPVLVAELDGVVSRLWRIDEPAEVEAVLGGVDGPLLIADGHHRYESALRFHEEDGTQATAHALAVLVALDDPGLEIFPTHRVTAGRLPELNGEYSQTPLSGPAQAAGALAAAGRDRPAFVLLRPEGAVLVEGGDQGLDTALVDSLGLEEVLYTPSADEAERAVASGRATAAFLVRPPTVEQVEEFAHAGVRMPQKSTYFFPKLTGGLLFSPFDE